MAAFQDPMAKSAVQKAVKDGRLSRDAPCEACCCPQERMGPRSLRVILHHWSYAPEHYIDVIPLCQACHALVHQGAIPEPRTGRIYNNRKIREKKEPQGAQKTFGRKPQMRPTIDPATARKARAMTVAEAARRMEVTTDDVERWEAGLMPPSAHNIVAMAEAYEFSDSQIGALVRWWGRRC